VRQNLSDAALVLLGHGTTLNAESAAPVYQHAAELRRRKHFENVHEAFWKQSPRVSEVISTLRTRRVFIVPLFLSEGYFSEEVIPQELGFKRPGQTDWARSLRRQDQTFFYCKPVGANRRITDVLLDRAREVAESFPFPRVPKPKDTTLFIAGHGTDQNQNSRKAVERQVDLLRKLDLYAAVHGIFLEEEPRIGA